MLAWLMIIIDYSAKMPIKPFRRPPFKPDLSPSDFWKMLKLKPRSEDYSFEFIYEMKYVQTKELNPLTLKGYNKYFQK